MCVQEVNCQVQVLVLRKVFSTHHTPFVCTPSFWGPFLLWVFRVLDCDESVCAESAPLFVARRLSPLCHFGVQRGEFLLYMCLGPFLVQAAG